MGIEERKHLGKVNESVGIPIPDTTFNLPQSYDSFIQEIKKIVSEQKIRIYRIANTEMILMYWQIGNAVLEKQKIEGWGTKVIDRMSYDLKNAFPDMNGFSTRNIKYMRKFAESWEDIEFVQRCVAQIPWRSNITLLDKLNDRELRIWYAQKALEYGMSKDTLVLHIENQLHKREGAILSNFNSTLPDSKSDMVQQSFKDPYIFDFLGTDSLRMEKELEKKLIEHIQKFLIELGQGFAFVGKQVHIEFNDQDFYIDLLFYHLKLRCFVVVELKTGAFKPEYISKLNFYQNIVNDVLKHETDNPTLGLLLVKEKNRLLVEYSLINNFNPTGVANWETSIKNSFPDEIKDSLPTIEEIENELLK